MVTVSRSKKESPFGINGNANNAVGFWSQDRVGFENPKVPVTSEKLSTCFKQKLTGKLGK